MAGLTIEFFEFLYHSFEYVIFLGYILIFLFIGLFINPKSINDKIGENDKKLIRIIKYSIIFYLLILTIVYICLNLPVDTIFYSIGVNLNDLKWRFIEIVSWYYGILVIMGIVIVAKKFISLVMFIEKKFDKKEIYRLKTIYNEKKTQIMAVFVITLFIFSFYGYIVNYDRIDYNNRYTDKFRNRIVLQVGEYFYNNPLENESLIFVEPVQRNWLYTLLYDEKLIPSALSDEMLSSYMNFVSNFNQSARYVICNKTDIEPFINEFNANFYTHFENEQYLFAEYLM